MHMMRFVRRSSIVILLSIIRPIGQNFNVVASFASMIASAVSLIWAESRKSMVAYTMQKLGA